MWLFPVEERMLMFYPEQRWLVATAASDAPSLLHACDSRSALATPIQVSRSTNTAEPAATHSSTTTCLVAPGLRTYSRIIGEYYPALFPCVPIVSLKNAP